MVHLVIFPREEVDLVDLAVEALAGEVLAEAGKDIFSGFTCNTQFAIY